MCGARSRPLGTLHPREASNPSISSIELLKVGRGEVIEALRGLKSLLLPSLMIT